MEIEITKDEYLTVHNVKGLVSEEEMHDALEMFYKEDPTPLLLWDMSQSDVSNVTPDILQNFARKSAKLGASRQGGRTAVIAPEDLQYGLARISEAFLEIESSPHSFSVFRTREKALQWLMADENS